jgi:hypothetical protein
MSGKEGRKEGRKQGRKEPTTIVWYYYYNCFVKTF